MQGDIERYLWRKNEYVDNEDNVSDAYRADKENHCLAPLPESLASLADGIHMLIQSVFDESVLADMVTDGNRTKIQENALNDNFYKKSFRRFGDILTINTPIPLNLTTRS